MRLSALKHGTLFSCIFLLAPAALGQSKISITPAAATVLNSGVLQFTPDTKGEDLGPFKWQVNGKDHGDDTVGRITDKGVYTAPAEGSGTTSVAVTVISTSHPNLQGTAYVLIGRQAISLSPLAATVATSHDMILSASWIPGLGSPQKWQVNGVDGGNKGFGWITSISDHEARYEAPDDTKVASTVTVPFSIRTRSSSSQAPPAL